MLASLSLSFLLAGCAVGSMPKWPEEVKNQYTLDIKGMAYPKTMMLALQNPEDVPLMRDDQQVRCLQFEITSQNPYLIKFLGEVNIRECQGLTGFKANDALKIFNWFDDMIEFLKDRKKCFK